MGLEYTINFIKNLMNDQEILLGLFYADVDNLIFDNIRYSENFIDMKINDIKMLSYKFLGLVFITAASGFGYNWEIR